MNKGQSQPKPKIAGLDYLNFPTNETNHPHVYFAGARNLPLSWVMQPIISKTKATPTGSGKAKGGSKGGKGGSGGSKDYYGHCLGVVCQCQIDFIWGFLNNNDLAWPDAKEWDDQIYNSGRQIISTDGRVYKASEKTSVDPTPTPPGFPWVLHAIPYVAGTYNVGDKVLYLGNVWNNYTAANNLAPGATIPVSVPDKRGVQGPELINGWGYLSTPDTYSAGHKFWDANSVVAWKGFLWINAAGTKDEPGTSGAWIRWKQDLTAIANPFKFTVPHNGDIYCYRGTANQVLDTVNEKILAQFGHPPYRNKAGFMLHDFLFGTSQPNPSDMVAMCGRTPVQNIIIGAAALMDARWQVNPWCVLAEVLTHPACGLGLPESWFDKVSWQAEADRCYANPSLFYISPLWTSLSKVYELVADLMSYPDAFIFMNTLKNLTAGHWPHNEAAPAFTAANTVNVNNLIDEIQSSSELWGGTNNSVQVSCSDAASGFTNRPAFAQNLFNLGVVKRMQSTSIDRPHITDFAQASKWAAEFSKVSGDMLMSGELPVQAEKAAGIQVGSIFLLTDDVLDVSLPLRCTRRTVAGAPVGVVRIGYEVERGVAPQAYSPTANNPVPTTGPAPARITNFTTIQLPATLGPASSIAVLAGRSNDQTSELDVWFRQSDAVSFQDLGKLSSFAVPGIVDFREDDEHTYGTPGVDNAKLVHLNGSATITAGNTYAVGYTGFWKLQVFYSSFVGGFPFNVGVEGTDFTVDIDTGNITILASGSITTGKYVNLKIWKSIVVGYDTSTPQSDLDLILESMTSDEIKDGKVLLVCVQAANTALFEIMRVEQVVATGLPSSQGLPTLTIDVIRAQFGTLKGGDGSHLWGADNNDLAFVLRKDGIVPLEHVSFQAFQAAAQTMNVRLVPSSAWENGDVVDVFDAALNPQGLTTEFTYQWSNVYAPTVTFGSLQKNGVDIGTFATNFAAADVFSFSFAIKDTNGDLIHAAMVAYQGQQEVLLWGTNFAPSAEQFKTVNFSLPKGNWTVEMRMLDQAGNQSAQVLTFGGNPVTIYVDNGTAASPVVLAGSYSDKNGYRTNLLFGPLPATGAGFQVYYQLQNRDVALNAGAWVACSDVGAVTGGRSWGDAAFGNVIPPIKKGSAGKTLYAYCTQTGKTDSAPIKWDF